MTADEINVMLISKVISGGQTGVDQAALRAAKTLGIPTGGYAPKGWKTEDGPAPWLANYGLVEHQGGYSARTRANVAAAGLTLILLQAESDLSGGTALTLQIAKSANDRGVSGFAVFLIVRQEAVAACQHFLSEAIASGVSILNVAGPRESKSPGIGELAEKFLRQVFTEAPPP
jgi:fructose-specific component phosphotransferase system IIB-like protein